MNNKDYIDLLEKYAKAIRRKDFEKALEVNQLIYEGKFKEYLSLYNKLRELEVGGKPEGLGTLATLDIKSRIRDVVIKLDNLGDNAIKVKWKSWRPTQ